MHSLPSVVQCHHIEMMHSESIDFIRKFCSTFQLGPEIEFTCYEVYPNYFQRYFNELRNSCHFCSSNETNHMVEILYKTIGDEFTLNTSILIAICTKYIDGIQGQNLFKAIPKFLVNMGCPSDISQVLTSEFIVFRCLNFHVGILVMIISANDDWRMYTIINHYFYLIRSVRPFCMELLSIRSIELLADSMESIWTCYTRVALKFYGLFT